MLIKRIICSILFILGLESVNAQIFDDFEQVTLDTHWHGDISKFRPDQGKLRSNSSSIGDQFEVKRAVKPIDTAEFNLDIDLPFATSSANYVVLNLTNSDSEMLRLKFGGTSDNISMEYWETGKLLYSVSSPDKVTENSTWKLKCLMGKSSFFNCEFNNLLNSYKLTLKEDFFLNTIDSIGIRIVQSSPSFHFKHYFDNLYFGPIQLDTAQPELTALTILDSSRIDLLFNEAIDTIKLDLGFENGLSHQYNWTATRPDLLSLHLNPLPENGKALVLHINHLEDTAGNVLDTSLKFDYIYGEYPNTGDIVFSELMIDPTPSVRLPESEYIEIFNVSQKYFNLKNWHLQDPKSDVMLPNFLIKPGKSLLLVPQNNLEQFIKIGIENVIGLYTWPSLNNESDTLWLLDSSMKLVSRLWYELESKATHWKSQGGWSFELSDMERSCVGWPIWFYSENSNGGSPGEINKVLSRPIGLEVFKIGEILTLTQDQFSFKTNRTGILKDSFCFMYDAHQVEQLCPIYQVGDDLFQIEFESSLEVGAIYTLHLKSLYDCLENQMDTSLIFGIPTPIHQGDLKINEILFNPKTNDGDYLELINVSNEIKDLREIMIVTLDSFDEFKEQKTISDGPVLLFPHSLICLTKDPTSVSNDYQVPFQSPFLACSLPTLPNSFGHVAIALRNGDILEHLMYNEDLHSYFIKDPKGVSLERRNAQIPVHVRSNWTSASATQHYGTPGYENSQALRLSENANFTIHPKVFSPNGDNIDDAITIYFSSPDSNSIAYVHVFDVKGKIIKTLLSGNWVGAQNTIIWDGLTDTQLPAPAGKYIVLINNISLQGNYYREKAITHLIR